MFGEFQNQYSATGRERAPGLVEDENSLLGSKIAVEFLNSFGGVTFNHGIYRVHSPQNLARWNLLVADAFPQFSRRIRCFGYDWLGRQFALDDSRRERGNPMVLLLEPGTGLALEIPSDFARFHDAILCESAEAALAIDAFEQWRLEHPSDLAFDKCVGYRLPLFLGGDDTPENFEVSDMEVYWSICSQMLSRTRDLPEGTKIGD